MVLKNFTNMKWSFLFFFLLFSFTRAEELISVNATTTFTFTGNSTYDHFGFSVSSAGDINNDGYEDILIGASMRNGQRGAVYVIYGGEKSTLSSMNFSQIVLDPLTTGFVVTGDEKFGYLGHSVSGAGDINKDGYDDIIIGADGKRSFTGVVYVIYGGEKSSMQNIDLSRMTLNPLTTGFTIKGNTSLDHLGKSVSSAGDINNDGYADIIIGAPGKSTKTTRGAAYIIYGGEKSAMSNIDLKTMTLDPLTTGFIIDGDAKKDSLGFPVSTAGDMNKDGYADILIGASGKDKFKGAAYIVYGGPKSKMSNINLANTTLDPLTTGFMIKGKNEGDRLGMTLSRAGDINNDGYADIIIAIDPESRSNGTAYVVYGGPKSSMSNIDFSNTTLNPLTTGFTIKGATSSDQLGKSVSCAGDINKDGIDDILIGAWFPWNGATGKAYVIYGRASGLSDIDLSSPTSYPITTGFMIPGPPFSNSDRFTQSIVSIDINNDGFSDLLIADPGTNGYQGSVYLYILNECPQNCKTCSSTSDCTECFGGYAFDNNSQCKACPSHCNVCGSSGNLMECDICSSGYYLSYSSTTGNGICQSCSEGCTECSNDSVCNVCSSGKYLFQDKCFKTCPPSTFPGTDGTCQGCSVGCTKCSSDSVCDVCSSEFSLSRAQCVCPSGKYLFQGTCFETCPPSTFPRTDGACQNCLVGCTKCPNDLVCDVCSSGKYLFQSLCVDTCPSSTFPETDGTCQSCPAGCNQCSSDSVCQTCADGFTLSDSKSCIIPQEIPQEIPEEKKEEKASAGALERIFEGMSLIGASLTSGSSLPSNFGMAAKILRNAKYLNITVSPELNKTFHSWKVASGFIAAPKSWSLKSESKDLPGVFSRYGLSPVFLMNFWKPFVLILIGFAIFMIFKSIEMVLTKNNDRKNILWSISKYVNITASNFALVQFYSNLDDVILYFIIEVKYTESDTGFSMILAVILLMLGGIFIGLHSKLLNHYQAVKNQTGSPTQLETFIRKCENIRLIMRDFKDITLLTQSFLLINLIRSMISSLIIAILFDYPLLQITFLFILNSLIIVYLLAKKPFKELFDTYGQLFCEAVLLIVNICVFILAVLPYPILSQCIIILNEILLLGCSVLLVINIGKFLKTTYQDRKNAESAKSPGMTYSNLFAPGNDKNQFEFVQLAEDNHNQKNSEIESSNLSNEQEHSGVDKYGC